MFKSGTNLATQSMRRILSFMLLTLVIHLGPASLLAQDDCCEYYSIRYENASDNGECCFRMFLTIEEEIPCSIGAYAITILGESVSIEVVENGDFDATVNENSVVWTGDFSSGENDLGVICIEGDAASYTYTTAYFNTETKKWVECNHKVEMHCAINGASLCGVKFEDINCNGVRDEGEPGIPDWEIKIYNQANQTTFTTTTDENGNYKFTDLDLAPWYIYESQVKGWAQTSPETGRYYRVLTSDQTIENLDFGNVRVCEETENTTYLAGAKDDFSTSTSDPDPFISDDLATFLEGRTVGGFDNTNNDEFFGLSFTDYSRDECCLVGASLRIRLKTNSSSLSSNDGIGFLQDGEVIYYNRISTLLGVTWQGQPGTELVLDLGNLLENRGTSVLPALRDGTFDLYLQDDTSVDWAELTVEYCCYPECCQYLTPTYDNNASAGACCFDFNVNVADDVECSFEKVRMTVLGDGITITYGGTVDLDYTINGNVITVNKNLVAGANSLGTFCIDGSSDTYNVVFEYFDSDLQTWLSCEGFLEVFCLIQNGALCGTKFEDLNCNGVYDEGEPGLAGWEIKIVDRVGGVTLTTTTDAEGNYKFEDLSAATWFVFETQQEGWAQTFPASGRYRIELQSDQTVENLNFGNIRVCDDPQEETENAGSMDDFGPGADNPPANPSDALLNFLEGRSPVVGFDNATIDRIFAHSFSGFADIVDDGCCIVGAQLTVRLRTNNSGLSFNDNIVFVQDGQAIWSSRIGTILNVNWVNQAATTMVLDLGNLPGGLGSSIIPSLLDGTLDFYIADDTSVDWAELTVQYCCSSDCCEDLQPVYGNAIENGECCFDLGIQINNEDFACNFSAVRMTVLGEPVEIQYDGDGSHEYDIDGNVISVSIDLAAGLNELGIYCISGETDSYTIRFEYFDTELERWVSCDTELEVFCLIESGVLCGMKFEDLNCNGVKDDGEPGLADWEITIVDRASGVTFQTTTDDEGNYKFEDLQYATWFVFETQQDDWVQTFPASGRYRVEVNSNETIENLDFGNVRKCEKPQTTTYQAGSEDNFGPGADDPAASPSDMLLEFLEGRSPVVGFDNSSNDRHFAHTFVDDNPLIGNGCCPVGAVLTLRLKTNSSSLSRNDALVFVQDGVAIYGVRISTLAGNNWQNQPAQTVTIDLGDLPGGLGSSILPSLLDGTLDFYIQDDTSVDWARLDVEYCCQEAGQVVDVDETFGVQTPKLRPNPASQKVTLDFFVPRSEDLEFEITNLNGQSILIIGSEQFAIGQHSLQFDLGSLTSGTYYLQIRSSKGHQQTLPFTVQR